MTARVIRLRRPATLSLHSEPFVPERAAGAVIAEIERRWANLCKRIPACFDGRVCHVIGVHRNGYGGAVIHVADCAFRYHAVQDERFDLGVRPLGVKGITMHEGRVLLGKRSAHVAACPGMWEFAPGGVVEPGEQPAEVARRELMEETGLAISREPQAIAVMYDPLARSWELVFKIDVASAHLATPDDEYDATRWCSINDLPAPLSPAASTMTALVESVVT